MNPDARLNVFHEQGRIYVVFNQKFPGNANHRLVESADIFRGLQAAIHLRQQPLGSAARERRNRVQERRMDANGTTLHTA